MRVEMLINPHRWHRVLALLVLIAATNFSAAKEALTNGWEEVPFTYKIQKPHDLNLEERYQFNSTGNVHRFWVYFTDKSHEPPPNRTAARTEMRLETYTTGERMFDADVNVQPGTFACIMQVFDEKRGPINMLIAHPNGNVTIGNDEIIKTNAIGSWWNLKVTNDPAPGGKIRFYVDDVLVGTYESRGPREYYFKCGVYSRRNSDRSEAWFRNVKMWKRPSASETARPKAD